MEKSRYARAVELLAWDGCLPVLIMATPMVLREALHPDHPAALIAAVLLPALGAIARFFIGRWQIRQRCGRIPALRAYAMGLAIFALLICEFHAGLIAVEPGKVFPVVWLFPAGFFLLYLVLVYGALHAPRASPELPYSKERCMHLAVRLVALDGTLRPGTQQSIQPASSSLRPPRLGGESSYRCGRKNLSS